MGGLPWIFGSYLFEIILCLLLNVLVTDRLVAFKIKTILNFQLAFYNKISHKIAKYFYLILCLSILIFY